MTPTRLLAVACAVALACTDRPEEPLEQPPPSDVEALRARVAADPRDADAWFRLAEHLERAEHFEDEADALRKVVALQPDAGWALMKLGATYNRLGRWQDAVDAFERARRTGPPKAVLYNNLAFSYGKLGHSAEQVAALRKAVALRPRYAIARYNLGVALLARGDRRGAEEQVRLLAALDEGAAASLRGELDRKGASR